MTSFDAYIDDVSRFGRYQFLQTLLSFLSVFSAVCQTLAIIFTGQTPDFRCDDELTTPGLNSSDFFDANSTKVCLANGTCPAVTFSAEMQTVVTKYNLVCDRMYLVSLISTFYMIGFFWGGTIYGYVSDRVGRRYGCLFSGLHTLICATIAAFAPNYWMYVIIRALTAVGTSGQIAVALTYCAECASSSNRAIVLTICILPWSSGLFFLCLISYLLQNQTHIDLVLAGLSLFSMAIFVFCYESPRWLMSQGRTAEAKTVLDKIVAIDKRQLVIDSEELQEWISSGNKETNSQQVSFKEFMVYPGLRRLSFSIWFINATAALAYYGFFYGISSLDGLSVYVQVIIGASIEFVCIPCLIPAFKYCERLWLSLIAFLFVGFFTLISCVLIGDPSMALAVTVLCSIARPIGGFLFNVEALYTVEIYPTTHRTLGVGCMHSSARFGSILATQLVSLGMLWKPAPYVLICACCVAVVLLTCFLPESKYQPCPETITEAEEIINQHCFYREQLCCQRRLKALAENRTNVGNADSKGLKHRTVNDSDSCALHISM